MARTGEIPVPTVKVWMRKEKEMNTRTKKITWIAALSAIAFVVMFLFKMFGIVIIPDLPFLTYDPKDIIIAIGGILFGPVPALVSSFIVSLLEMVTISTTGPIGAVMNVLSTSAFACMIALVCRKKKTTAGLVIALVLGVASQTAIMLLWNYLISPIYMGIPREAIKALLIPGFLPFNLIKGGINAILTFLLFGPIKKAAVKSKIA